MKMNSKKGVSPLIATVLIIALTVALTVFLMNWAFGFFKERTESTSRTTEDQLFCVNSVDMDVVCSCQAGNTGNCFVTVSNNNQFDFGANSANDKLFLRLISANQKVTADSTSIVGTSTTPPLKAFEIKPATGSITMAKPASSVAPYNFEVVVPRVNNTAKGRLVECGNLAKVREVCDMNAP